MANPDCIKARSFAIKLQEICKLFLIVLEDYMRFTYWSEYYSEYTNYTCFDIFKDYYEDANFYIDRSKLIKIEEDIWIGYSNNVIMLEDHIDPGVFNINNYGLNLNFLNYDLDFDMNDGEICTDALDDIGPKLEELSIKLPSEKKKKDSLTTVSKKQLGLKDLIKFTKKENVDKKLLRKFRKYLKELYKKNSLPNISSDFWYNFIKHNLLPPVQCTYQGEPINFKSFNTNYILWLFSHEGGIELYDLFLSNRKNDIHAMFVDLVKCQQDANELIKYVETFAVIYSCKDMPIESGSTLQNAIEEETSSPTNKGIFDIVFDTSKE
jgi:hypothetical protein